VRLRPEHGFSATFCDTSPALAPKSLRGHFGRFYDQSKIGNTERFAELNPRAPFVAKIDVKPFREQAEA
jgi:hypothetical protein